MSTPTIRLRGRCTVQVHDEDGMLLMRADVDLGSRKVLSMMADDATYPQVIAALAVASGTMAGVAEGKGGLDDAQA